MDEKIGFGLYHPVGKWGALDVYLYLGCSGVGAVGGEWAGIWTRVLRGGVVLCLCEL